MGDVDIMKFCILLAVACIDVTNASFWKKKLKSMEMRSSVHTDATGSVTSGRETTGTSIPGDVDDNMEVVRLYSDEDDMIEFVFPKLDNEAVDEGGNKGCETAHAAEKYTKTLSAYTICQAVIEEMLLKDTFESWEDM